MHIFVNASIIRKKPLLGYVTVFKYVIFILASIYQPVYSQLQEMHNIRRTLPTIKDSTLYADALNRLAMLSHLRFRDSCLIYATKAREISVRKNYQKGVADAMNCQGIYYMSANNYLSAKFLNDALKIYQSLGDRSNEAQLKMNLAVLMFVSNNKKEALQYIYEADDLSKVLPNDSIRSIILTDILAIDPGLSVTVKDSLYRKGLEIARKYKDTRMIISFENNEGTILYNLGQKQKGLDILLGSLKKADSIGCEYIKVAAFMTLGEMMLDLGREKEGIAYYEKGLETSDKYGYPERYLMLAERLYNHYKASKKPEKAYEYASLLLSKQTETSENLKKSGYNYLSYVLKESELSQLKKDEKIRTNWFLLMACFSLLVLIVLFFVYQSLLNKKRLFAIQKQLYVATEERNQDLREEDGFKEMIISVIAHDVRQPFSSIVMLSGILNSPADVMEEEKTEIMSELQLISSNALSFMDGILDWIKSRKLKGEIVALPLNVKTLLVESNSFFAQEQYRNGVSLILDIDAEIIISAHKQMTLFIFRNLLNNATKFSPRGGVIHVTFSKNDAYVTLAFSDNGPGMSPDQLSGLFQVVTNSSHNKGAGLALSISYDMIRKMGGRIWAESQSLKGTTFFVSLPVG